MIQIDNTEPADDDVPLFTWKEQMTISHILETEPGLTWEELMHKAFGTTDDARPEEPPRIGGAPCPCCSQPW
jgi:hypothetical protein